MNQNETQGQNKCCSDPGIVSKNNNQWVLFIKKITSFLGIPIGLSVAIITILAIVSPDTYFTFHIAIGNSSCLFKSHWC